MLALSFFNVDSTRGLLSLARDYKINFDMKDGMRCFPYNFDYSVVSRVPTYDDVL